MVTTPFSASNPGTADKPDIQNPVKIAIKIGAGVLCLVLFTGSLALLASWKPIDAWISFGRDFATSPAMAGLAALGAAIIGARSLKRQFDQSQKQLELTQNEAVHARTMDFEASWWQKFEWVTDRILPREPDRERLATPLALGLLTSLLQMTTAEFQRGAVEGVIEHYLSPDEADNKEKQASSSAELSAEVRALRSLVEALNQSPGKGNAAESALRASMYDESATRALREAWPKAEDVLLRPRVHLEGRTSIPDAVVSIDGLQAIVEFKSWEVFRPAAADQVLERFARVLPAVAADKIVLVTSAPIPQAYAPGGSRAQRFEDLHLVQWLPEDGSADLVRKIRDVLLPPATE